MLKYHIQEGEVCWKKHSILCILWVPREVPRIFEAMTNREFVTDSMIRGYHWEGYDE